MKGEMTMKNRVCALLLFIALLLTMIACGKKAPEAPALEEEMAALVASGECGTNLMWTYDESGKLTISATEYGAQMEDYSIEHRPPWFDYHEEISTLEIENGVGSIGNLAFAVLTSLESVTIPESITSIGNTAFGTCVKLKDLTISNGVTSIGETAFNACSQLGSLIIPKSVIAIGEYAFSRCDSLKSVTLSKSVESIGYNAFIDCESLENVVITDGATSIREMSFYGCSALKCITIPASVTTIGQYAFGNCAALTDIYYEGTQEQWNAITIAEFNEPLATATIHTK